MISELLPYLLFIYLIRKYVSKKIDFFIFPKMTN